MDRRIKMNIRHLYVVSFAVVLGIIAWGDISQCKELPWPPRIVATGIVFGMLDLSSDLLGDIAPLVAVGIVLAAIVNNNFSKADCAKRLSYATSQPADLQNLQGTQGNVAL
jgi:hypothetical protein